MVLGFAGCKSEKDPGDPSILGTPPDEAYLGVEYSYNFGAFGGDDILDYSLSNAPSWLALEATSNKARQGIIMRGVPGLSGGNRGEEDLGETTGINLLGTDGQRVGVQPFNIEVKENLLSLDATDDIMEGKAGSAPAQSEDACEVPVVGKGRHRFETRVFDENGDSAGTEQRTRDTYAMLVTVELDQPSVTPITVAWELRSRFDSSATCSDSGTDTEQECFYNGTNRSQAEIGVDVVGLGTDSEDKLPVPEDGALTYLDQDGDGQSTAGLLHFEPGLTECYIRVEVIEDRVPEFEENFRIALTEVREGLASAGRGNDGTELGIGIEDNEPRVRLETAGGSARDVINVKEDPEPAGKFYPEYRAVLTGNRADRTISAKIATTNVSDLQENGQDFQLQVWNKDLDDWEDGDVVIFDPDTSEVRFRAIEPVASPAGADQDQTLILAVSNDYANGRVDYAAKEADTDNLRLTVNELLDRLAIGDANFVATDIAIGIEGQILVAGYDSSDRSVSVKVYDRKGQAQTMLDVDRGPVLAAGSDAGPVISYGNLSGLGRSNGFVIAYPTDTADPVNGTDNAGGMDSYVATYFYNDPDDGTGDPEYTPIWEHLSGTSGDDIPRSVAFGSSGGYVTVAGDTSGTWPERSSSGAVDTYLQRIDTVPVKDNEDELEGELLWTRQIGSSLSDFAVAVSGESGTPILMGRSKGTITENVGRTDFFFYSSSGADAEINPVQAGTEEDDTLTDGIYTDSRVWLVGNTTGNYQVEVIPAEEEDQPDTRELATATDGDSTAGFLVSYSTSGEFGQAIALNDADDLSTENFTSLIAFDGDLIAGGSSDGKFDENQDSGSGERLALARAKTDNDEDEPLIWRSQSDVSGSRIVGMANNSDTEITALVRRENGGSVEWLVQLFSGEGRALNPIKE
jgi:hypothetical protein